MEKKHLGNIIIACLVAFAAGAMVFCFFPKKFDFSIEVKLCLTTIVPMVIAGAIHFGRWLNEPDNPNMKEDH